MYLGSLKYDQYLTFGCSTHDPDTGASAAVDGADPAYRIYEDEVETPIMTGTLTAFDIANVTGQYTERIQLTEANDFVQGRSYRIVITATVGGVAASTERTFQIGAGVDVGYWKSVSAPDIETEAEFVAAVHSRVIESEGSITHAQALNIIPY